MFPHLNLSKKFLKVKEIIIHLRDMRNELRNFSKCNVKSRNKYERGR